MKILKVLEKNTGKALENIGIDNALLNKAQEIRARQVMETAKMPHH
jgi:hypothetical protein